MLKTLYQSILPKSTRAEIKNLRKQFYGKLFLKGTECTCNVCGNCYKAFLPKGNGIVTRQNAECPNCASLERTRLLKFYLENETEIQSKHAKILHFAPEDGLRNWIKSFQPKENYINGDLLKENADEIIDITQIQYPDKHFNLIICSHVLGHVPDQQKAINEMFRVLKDDGVVLVLTLLNTKSNQTINSNENLTEEERLQRFGEHDLVRLHGKETLKKAFEKSGFCVTLTDYRQNFSEQEQKKYALGNGERELIFKLTKPNPDYSCNSLF